jgi:hypothetical protein
MEYYWALIEHGILKKEAQQFKAETEVWKEVLNTLGSEFVSNNMSRTVSDRCSEPYGSIFERRVGKRLEPGQPHLL